MRIYVKYTTSLRCKVLVQDDLKKMGLQHTFLDYDIVEILEGTDREKREQVKTNLIKAGWHLLDSEKSLLVEKIKNVIVDMIHRTGESPKMNYSAYISRILGYNYTYLNNIFAELNGVSIQQFIITQKIERVKELLSYGEINLTEISYRLHYSSVGHLSRQFKKITGFSPTFFKQLHQRRSSAL